MSYSNKVDVYIDGINRTYNFVYPLKCANFLDERLDECILSLRAIKKEIFKPLTPVEIRVRNTLYWGVKHKVIEKEKKKTYHFIVANDIATEMQVGTGIYDHELYLIEVTKAAECFVVDTITFTNDLGRNYGAQPVSGNIKYWNIIGAVKTETNPDVKTYKATALPERFQVLSFYDTHRTTWITTLLQPDHGYGMQYMVFVYKLSDYKGRTRYQEESILEPAGTAVFQGILQDGHFETEQFIDLELGEQYLIEYVILEKEIWVSPTGNTYNIRGAYCDTFQFATVENKLPLKKWTITDVIKRTLDLAEPLRKGETPRFRLNAEQEEQFDKILAPQFSFTKQTLRECLQEVGKVVHGEPRLLPIKDEDGKWIYEVSFDMYAGQERSGLYSMPYILKTVSLAITSYASHLDSSAENFVDELDKFSGVIVEPYRDGAKTVRTENLYVRIQDNNMIIPTQYPIYSVEKLEYVYANGVTNQVYSVDITPWLFEKTVYDTQLSSYAEQYPYSKAFGLYYSQGNKNIGGLNFKVDAAVLASFKNYAITNILRSATNSSSEFDSNYPEMCFRVTYTPFFNARVAQTKVNYKDFKYPAALIYNQQANVIESRAYGESLKGTVARLGNMEKTITHIMGNIALLPQAGQMYDKDYYISAVSTEIYPTLIKCTTGLSKDFNRLSAYIGINSEKRYSEISQNQAVERNTLYHEYIVVGAKETPDSDCLVGSKLLEMIAHTFTQNVRYETFINGDAPLGSNLSATEYKMGVIYRVEIGDQTFEAQVDSEADGGSDDYYLRLIDSTVSGTGKVILSEDYPLTNVCAWGTSYKGTDIAKSVTINLPVISSAFGNSISFSWKYKDNYSAGEISEYIENAIASGNDKVAGYFQNSQPYTDYYGRLYYYNFDLQPQGPSLNSNNLNEVALNLPKGTKPTLSSGYLSTIGKTPYIMRKDNREALQVNFQIDFVTNLDNLIIGSALASYCPAVRGSDESLMAKLYVFPTELNKFTNHVEAYEADIKLSDLPSIDITVTTSTFGDGYFSVYSGKFPANGKSWAIVTAQSKGIVQRVEDEFGNITEQKQVKGGDLLIGQNMEIKEGQVFAPIYFTLKREIFDKSVWKDVI